MDILKILFRFILKWWKLLLMGVVVVELLAVGLMLYVFMTTETQRVIAAELTRAVPTASPTPTATATLWPGPPPSPTPTATWPPTPMATTVLAASGFPPGFTPTPRPTREPVKIALPHLYPVHQSAVDVPVINQIYYPEPFFPAGTNNACGPVAMFAALQALGANLDYGRLRDVAVSHGFTSYGISKSGMVNTLQTLNYELGYPYQIEHGGQYSTNDLIREIRQGGVVIVLLRVRKEGGRYIVTADLNNSIGHFLIVESINFRSNTVRFAGSTLGMDKVPFKDFIQSWASNPRALTKPTTLNWRSHLKQETALNWALVIKPS